MSPIISTPACRAFRRSNAVPDALTNTRRKDESIKIPPVGSRRFSILRPAARAFSRACSLSSQTDTRAPPATSACAVTNPEPPVQIRRHACFEASDRRHRHLNFKVERPISARTKAMIQKRTTTCGSDQPSCSKWWWIGAILKTRLPVSLNDATWTMTDRVSTTKRPRRWQAQSHV